MALSQNEIARLTRVIALNGQLEISQSILNSIGYTPEKLALGMALADAWDIAREERDVQNDTRYAVATAKEKARKEASMQIASLRDNIDELIPNGSKKDSLLNRAVIVSGGSQRVSQKEADLMGDSKSLIRRVRRLPQDQIDLLAEYGWGETRLTETWDLVDAFEDADRAHADAMGDKEAKTEICVAEYKAMEAWFRRAVRLIHRELMIKDPQNRLRVVQRLELPISHPSRRGAVRRASTDPPSTTPEETPSESEESPSEPEEGSAGGEGAESDSQPETETEESQTVEEDNSSVINSEDAGVDVIDDSFEVIIDEEPEVKDEGGEPLDDGRG